MTTPVPPPENALAPKGESSRITKKATKDFTVEDLHHFRVNKHSFTIFVSGDPLAEDHNEGAETGVEFRMADRLEMNLNLLSSMDDTRPILINMATNGGFWEEGMQMFSALLMCPNPITVLATKHARSMSSIFPLAADKFVIRPPAQYMIHRGSYGAHGTEAEFDSWDIDRRKSNEMMLRLYVARLREQGAHKRSSDARIREMLQRRFSSEMDVYFSADEAVHAGFADAVFDGDLQKLRAKKKDLHRRSRMLEVLRRPIKVEVSVT